MGPSTLSSWALLISRALTARGIDATDVVFRRARLQPELLGSPNARYPLAGVQRLWALAIETTGDPCIGLEVGRRLGIRPPSMRSATRHWRAAICARRWR